MEDNKTQKTVVKYLPEGGKLDIMVVEVGGRKGILVPNNSTFGEFTGYKCDRCGTPAGAIIIYTGNGAPRATTVCEGCTESDPSEVVESIKKAAEEAKTLYVPKHVAEERASKKGDK